ncbi:hypothetical protein JW906_08700 [bacterium]|nr:hypothetical protein [bacterium]
MNPEPDLKILERKAFHSHWEDGFLEIFIGILFLTFLAGTILTSIGISHRWTYAVIGAGVLLFIVGKRKVTLPRTGQVRLGAKRMANRRKLFAVLITVQVLTAALLVLAWSGRAAAGPAAGFGLILRQALTGFLLFTVPFGAMAIFLENPWMLIPAFTGFLYESLQGILPKLWNASLTVGAGGLILLFIGIMRLRRFMRKYRIPEEEA